MIEFLLNVGNLFSWTAYGSLVIIESNWKWLFLVSGIVFNTLDRQYMRNKYGGKDEKD